MTVEKKQAGSPRLKPKGASENRGWRFTPEHWARLLEQRNGPLDEHDTRRSEGIAEFRRMLNK